MSISRGKSSEIFDQINMRAGKELLSHQKKDKMVYC